MIVRRLLARCLAWLAGGEGLFRPTSRKSDAVIRRRVVLAFGHLPTCDYYFNAPIPGEETVASEIHDIADMVPGGIALDAGTQVVIVRYLPRRWLRWLAAQRERIAGVVYFLDDDLPAVLQAGELPLRYALKTAWRYAVNRRLLAGLCNEVWVSTPVLAGRYAASSPCLLEPSWLPAPSGGQHAEFVYFYHGTWAHRREIEWLVPVVREIQTRLPDVWFEIIGTDTVRRLYHGIPRVRVVPPMSWPDYLAYTRTKQYQLGLAPSLESAFNSARSHVKVFDITRMGAVGVYSNAPPYAGRIVSGETGLLLENRPEDWIATVTRLLHSPEERARMAAQARRWCEATRQGASEKP
jgi:glycosyltransferase involved in cell wall biosynthesis